MGCGCNKNKNTPCVGDSCKKETPKTIEPPLVESEEVEILTPENEPPVENIDFKERSIEPSSVFKKIEMAKSFVSAIASRGVQNNKVSIPLKQLRVLGCFGNKDKGGELPPCEFLRKSSTPGKFFCGGCGCGDKKLTWLVGTGEEYSKLDYPILTCPLQMPGFTNYKESGAEEAISPITRRYYIENMNYEDIEKVEVSLPDVSTEEKLPDPPS